MNTRVVVTFTMSFQTHWDMHLIVDKGIRVDNITSNFAYLFASVRVFDMIDAGEWCDDVICREYSYNNICTDNM